MSARLIDVEFARDAFEYRDGNLYHKHKLKRADKGSLAGYLHKSTGYWRVKLKFIMYPAHRIIYAIVHGVDPAELHIDHINGIKHDNRIENLRLSTNTQNICNQKKAQATNKTGYLGVSISKRSNMFVAQIQVNGIKKRLGMFNTPQEASNAYQQARKQHFGEFA